MTIKEIQDEIIDEFSMFDDWMQRYEYIIDLGKSLPLIEEGAKTDENLIKGVELIHSKLKDTLFSKGLEVVELKSGDAFDADFAEAITQIPAGDKLKGKIVDVIEKGYKLGDKIIRFPKVVIGQ